MIFLTVGTSFPFDRLVRAIDEMLGQGLIEDDIFAQICRGGYSPKNMEYAEVLDKDEYDRHIHQASGLISHAGMGTISMALDHNKPLLVMPRRGSLGELVNEHQLAAAKKFEELGYVLAAYEAEQLPEKMKALRSFVPQERHSQAHAVAERIAEFLNESC
jgi:UDP-N-acetylglucosamine transferase subunit ALG13